MTGIIALEDIVEKLLRGNPGEEVFSCEDQSLKERWIKCRELTLLYTCNSA